VLALVVALNVLFGLAFYVAERGAQPDLTFADGIWWAMVTMTTVGYGDLSPVTPIGRYLVAYPTFLIGIGVVAYMVGVIADTVIQHFTRKRRGLMQIESTGHVLICNYPNEDRVLQLLDELRAEDRYKNVDIVLVTEALEELPEALQARGIAFVHGDPAREETLQRANVNAADGVFILPAIVGDPDADFKSYAIASLVEFVERETNRQIKTIVEVVRRENIKMLQRTNVDGIVSAEGLSGQLMVQEYLDPGVNTVVSQILTTLEGSQFYLHTTQLAGQRFREIQARVVDHATDMQIIGILRGGKAILNPADELAIEAGDQFVVLTNRREDFQAIEQELKQVAN